MADTEAATAAPPQVAPPAHRSAAARVASAVGRFLSLSSDVAVLFLLCASWTCSFTNAARIAASWVFGADSAAVVEELFYITIYAVVLLFAVAFVLAMALFLHCFVMVQLLRLRWRREGREIAGDSGARIILAAQEHDHERAEEEDDGSLDGDDCSFITGVAMLLCMCVGLLMVILAPEEQLGSELIDAGFFLASLTYCYIMFPSFATMVTDEWDEIRDISDLLTSLYLDG
ncbi:hypothetical protein EJB05_49129, partial [Eragrostis curvula]